MDYTAIKEQLKEYFKNLLIAQYHCSDKNKKFLDALSELMFAELLSLQIRNLCLNVDKSEGAQLDQVGEWVDVTRDYDNSILWDKKFFAFIDWNKKPNSILQGGFSNYKNFLTLDGRTMTWKNLQNVQQQTYKLGDNYYRQLIKLKIIKNSIKFTKKNIDDAIYQWSSGQVYTTWEKMKINYHYPIQYSQVIALALKKNCLPAPVACEIHTILV